MCIRFAASRNNASLPLLSLRKNDPILQFCVFMCYSVKSIKWSFFWSLFGKLITAIQITQIFLNIWSNKLNQNSFDLTKSKTRLRYKSLMRDEFCQFALLSTVGMLFSHELTDGTWLVCLDALASIGICSPWFLQLPLLRSFSTFQPMTSGSLQSVLVNLVTSLIWIIRAHRWYNCLFQV